MSRLVSFYILEIPSTYCGKTGSAIGARRRNNRRDRIDHLSGSGGCRRSGIYEYLCHCRRCRRDRTPRAWCWGCRWSKSRRGSCCTSCNRRTNIFLFSRKWLSDETASLSNLTQTASVILPDIVIVGACALETIRVIRKES